MDYAKKDFTFDNDFTRMDFHLSLGKLDAYADELSISFGSNRSGFEQTILHIKTIQWQDLEKLEEIFRELKETSKAHWEEQEKQNQLGD